MSDRFPEYEDRTPEEMKLLEAQMRPSSGVKAQNYVAPPADGYDVHGLWHTFGSHHRTGYATHAVSLHWMLSKVVGAPTQLVPHRNVDIDIERFPGDRYDMLFEWTKEAVGHPLALFCSWPPEVAAEMEGVSPNIIPYCAFEGDRVSAYCKMLATGPIFSEIWVVSDFVKSAFVEAGVPSERVRVVRPMLSEGPWTLPPLDMLAQRKTGPVTQDDPFLFGVLGTWQKRKGMHDLIRAYFGAFKREHPVKLVIKTSVFGDNLTIKQFKEKITDEISEIAKEFGDNGFPSSAKMPRISLDLGTDMTDQQVIGWLGELDCYANPSYGEGLGIPHVWAKTMGVPMVSSTYGAVADMIGEISGIAGSSKDILFQHQPVEVGPEIARIALMFDKRTRWGGYEFYALGEAMFKQFEAGRSFDLHGANAARSMFSAKACLPAVMDGLGKFLPASKIDEWSRR
jgi:glycosyltransferase involved in cell wall biosynthesis